MQLIISLALIFLASNSYSQDKTKMTSAQQEVFSVVEELFNAYLEGDSSRVSAVFADNAKLIRATYKDGKSIAVESSYNEFVNYVGGGLEKLHNEQLWDYTVSVDDNLATVWTRYAFFLDQKFNHCGSETFTLFKSDQGWKILLLADNSMIEKCDVPEKIMKIATNRK